MKRKSLNIIAGLGLLLVVTATSAMAQQMLETTKVEIPFAFTVGKDRLPAGKYIVSKNGSSLIIRNTSGKGAVAVLPFRRIGDQREWTKSRLVFNRYYGEYFLSQIWMPGDRFGRELRTSDRELATAKNTPRERTEIVIASN
ncbi:MAG TPA: hypothetical protein VKB46_28545 [Pyrinomonadaceae bacterium]|nr:hypothetical protein [Pyrinomonadaceae bacterium]